MSDALGLGSAAGIAGALGFGAFMIRRRERTCPHCRVYMPMLPESEDDAHLNEGQQTEEALGSVDYQVHLCPSCDHSRTFRRERWFTGYSRCPSCAMRTRKTTRRTLIAATQYSGGRVEITETCGHCSYDHSYQRSTPALPPPSSSSSSSSSGSFGGGSGGGGGSFGGGSSGGGGAGSSW